MNQNNLKRLSKNPEKVSGIIECFNVSHTYVLEFTYLLQIISFETMVIITKMIVIINSCSRSDEISIETNCNDFTLFSFH